MGSIALGERTRPMLFIGLAVVAVGAVAAMIWSPPDWAQTLPIDRGSGSGTGYPPPPIDPCEKLNAKIKEESEEIKLAKKMAMDYQRNGMPAIARKIEQGQLALHERRYARMLDHYKKHCGGQ